MSGVSTGKAAEALGVSTQTVKRYIEHGQLSAFKLPGGHWRIDEQSLRELMDAQAPPDMESAPY